MADLNEVTRLENELKKLIEERSNDERSGFRQIYKTDKEMNKITTREANEMIRLAKEIDNKTSPYFRNILPDFENNTVKEGGHTEIVTFMMAIEHGQPYQRNQRSFDRK